MPIEMLLALGLGYLLGSIPFGLILTRAFGKGDLRAIGSGSTGATNVLRTGSKWLAGLTALLDCLKGTAAVLIGWQLFGDQGGIAAAAGAIVGHVYPVWLKFRGGKGVATLFGILIALIPVAAPVYAVVWLLLVSTIRISSVAGMTAALSAPITAALTGHEALVPTLLGFALLIIWKHRENIVRLRKGTEPRIGSKASSTA